MLSQASSAIAAAAAPLTLLCFRLGPLRLGLPLAAVERVLRAAEATPLPGAPDDVLGALNVAGDVLAVLDLRPRFRLPGGPMDPEQQLLLVHCRSRRLALLVDQTDGVADYPLQAEVSAAAVVPQTAIVRGLLRMADGLLLITDADAVLSLDDAQALDRALSMEDVDAP